MLPLPWRKMCGKRRDTSVFTITCKYVHVHAFVHTCTEFFIMISVNTCTSCIYIYNVHALSTVLFPAVLFFPAVLMSLMNWWPCWRRTLRSSLAALYKTKRRTLRCAVSSSGMLLHTHIMHFVCVCTQIAWSENLVFYWLCTCIYIQCPWVTIPAP